MAAHVLIVDDDPAERRHLEDILIGLGHSVEAADGGAPALERVARRNAPPIGAIILDLVMPDIDGMAVLERLARLEQSMPVIVQVSAASVDAGAAAMRAGAFDFLVKPAAAGRLRVSLANALKVGALEGEIQRLRMSRAGTLGLSAIAMRSTSMERVRHLAERAARSSTPVLLEGERGVGKRLLARAIHASGHRRGRPFVRVRCPELAPADMTAALFGPGGKAAEAESGTLFLEEIASLTAEAQDRLAAMLAGEGTGDFRLIAATGQRLVDRVGESGFSEALFHRLNVLPIWLPPLRERRADIPAIAQGLVARFAAEAGRPGVGGLSRAALDLLVAQDWPGNIRALEQAIFRAVMLSDGGELGAADFPALSGAPLAPRGVAHQEQVEREAPPIAARGDATLLARYGVARLLDERGEMRSFGTLEEEVIRFAIGHYRGRMTEVARRLGIGRSTLYRKLKDYGIDADERVAS